MTWQLVANLSLKKIPSSQKKLKRNVSTSSTTINSIRQRESATGAMTRRIWRIDADLKNLFVIGAILKVTYLGRAEERINPRMAVDK